jgi:hypothetical protein
MKVLKSALVGAAALLSTGAFASNMGFKLVMPLTAPGAQQGINFVALPLFNSFTTLDTLCPDIGANATTIAVYDAATDTPYSYFCDLGFGDTPVLTKGRAVQVNVSVATNWTIVGSHDNAYAIPLVAPGAQQGINFVSTPYHTTATTLSGLCSQIGGNATTIAIYDAATDTPYSYFCDLGFGDDPAMTIGRAVQINVSATTNWTPAHY